MQTYGQYLESLRGKRVYFLGIGISHKQLIPRFAAAGARVTLCDKKSRAQLGEVATEMDALGVSLRLGADYLGDLENADVIFRSPGIDYTKPEIQAAVAAGADVTSEIETFFSLCPAKTIGVTGSDGKTTTTTLIAKILEAGGHTVHLGGNIGRPLLPEIEHIKPSDICVVELSSFQLISMRQSPDIALVTNVTPNHLDHHKDMEEYIDAKRNILLYQNADGLAVLNERNDVTRAMQKDVKGKLRTFSRGVVENGAFTQGGWLYLARGGELTKVMDLSELKILGLHNHDNLAAAAAVVMDLASPDVIRDVARAFTGVEHRIEFVREKGGVCWYNDSIATSPNRTIAGLRAFNRPIVLIAGGYDKNLAFDEMAAVVLEHVKLLLLCGPTAVPIERAVRAAPGFEQSGVEIVSLEDVAACVGYAADNTTPGDVVMLSPASSSFDKFENFEARGLYYKQLVSEL